MGTKTRLAAVALKRRPARAPFVLVAAMSLSACAGGDGAVAPRAAASSQAEAAPTGKPVVVERHFAFLPPLAAHVAMEGTFATEAMPVVTICRWVGDGCAERVATFDRTTGAGSERVRVDPVAEEFAVNWRTRGLADGDYRVDVTLDGWPLGSIVVTLAPAGGGPTTFNAGSTIPVKFRVERGAGGPPVLAQPDLTGTNVHVGIGDGALITRPTADGDAVQYLVARDDAGTPTQLVGVAKFSPTDPHHRDVLLLGADGVPERAVLSDGSQVYFGYGNPTQVRIEVVLSTGEAAAILVPRAPGSAALSGTSASIALPALPQQGVRTGMPRRPRLRASGLPRAGELLAPSALARGVVRRGPRASVMSLVPRSATLAATAATTALTVSVRAGHQGVTAPVTDAVVTGTYQSLANAAGAPTVGWTAFTATHVGSGRYQAAIPVPTGKSLTDALAGACSAANSYLDAACHALQASGYNLQQFAAACAQLLVVPGAGPKLAAACLVAVALPELVCLANDICSVISGVINGISSPGNSLLVDARVAGPGYNQQAGQKFEPPVSNPTIDVLLPLIVSLSVDPPDPGPFQSYNAVTRVQPAVNGLPVTSSMIGTDGYRQTNSGFTSVGGFFFMGVPGAEAGVQDFISTTVAGVTRTTSILF